MTERTTEPRLRILSLGAGVQSTALILMAANGHLPKLDAAIFADTGWESRVLYQHLDRVEAEVCTPAGIPLHRVRETPNGIRSDALDPSIRFASMPLFTKSETGRGGVAQRQCTGQYKLRPIKRKVRELLGTGPRTRLAPEVYVEQWIGISTDEFTRAKSSGVNYIENRFPLIELKWTRTDCINYLRDHGWGDVIKSACLGCPYHGNAEWREIRDNRPDEWADVVAFDKAIRNGYPRANAKGQELRDEFYLHPSLLPLDEAPIDKPEKGTRQRLGLELSQILGGGYDPESGFGQGCGPWSCRSGSTV